MEWIITAQQGSGKYALIELKNQNECDFIRRIEQPDADILIIRGKPDLAKILLSNKPIFIRHICPVHIQQAIKCEKDIDISVLKSALREVLFKFDKQKNFSVQSRFLGLTGVEPYKRFDINEALSNVILEAGFSLSVKSPEQIVSVGIECKTQTAHIGISASEENLSTWPGGARRFKRETGQISRAEFKLLEAIELFALNLPRGAKALDLGAAPGGWTRVLADLGLIVTSVDPAPLDNSLMDYKNVNYRQSTAQEFFRESKDTFDIMVNDMRMETELSTKLMCDMAPVICKNGVVIATLKLGSGNQLKQVHNSLKTLSAAYTIRGARQLFHNRNEITVFLSPLSMFEG